MPQLLTKLQRTEQQSLLINCQQLEEQWDFLLVSLSSVEWKLSNVYFASKMAFGYLNNLRETIMIKKNWNIYFWDVFCPLTVLFYNEIPEILGKLDSNSFSGLWEWAFSMSLTMLLMNKSLQTHWCKYCQ